MPKSRTLLPKGRITGKMVKYAKLELSVREQKGLVLGMDIHKTGRNILENLNRYRRIIHKGP